MGNDGRVWTTWWALGENNNRWHRWYPITDDPGNVQVSVFSKATPPAVLSRDPAHADVFVMGNDGRVWTTWWALGENNNRWHRWYPITDDPLADVATFSKSTPPAVVSRDSSHADVFVMGNDGRVWTTWWAGT
jgi:hypothetical protein